DRRALPAPELGAEGEAHEAPRTRTEEVLADIWSSVLGVERVGRTASFFALGGHSLLATRVVARAREAFRVELPLRALFEAPTLQGLAALVDDLLGDTAGAAAPPVVPVPRDPLRPLPLSFAQQRLWLLDQVDPGSAAHNVPVPLRLEGPLDPARLSRAVAALVDRHEALRTRLPAPGGEPVQVVEPAGSFVLAHVDLSGLRAGARERETAGLAAADAARPFDLARGPLFRAALLRLGNEDHALLACAHHAVCDEWSTGILLGELSALYGGAPLPPLAVQYADFAVWQRARLAGGTLDRQLAWWTERLRGAPPVLELPTDRPRSAAADDREDEIRFTLPRGTADAVHALAAATGATPFMVVLSAWQALLGRYAGQDEVVVGTQVDGRTRAETEGLIGLLANTLALRADLSGGPGFGGLLARVSEATLHAFARQELPFERLVDALAIERSPAHHPLFQAGFAFRDVEPGELRLGAASAGRIPVGGRAARLDVSLAVAERDGGLAGSLAYRRALLDGATAERMAEHFARLLAAAAAEPEARVSALPLLDAAGREQVLRAWNATAADFPPTPVHLLVAEQAARTPDAPAVVAGEERLTYAELESRAEALAVRLRALGAGPDSLVGVCMERSPEMIAAVLAVLKAGGAYVPVDPAYPEERIAHLLADSGSRVLLTQARLAGRLEAFGAETVVCDTPEDAGAVSHSRTFALSHSASPDNLAYVIYTSGSTGTPRGVAVPHGALGRYVQAARERFGIGAGDRVLQFASLAFDASAEEIFPALAGGAALVLRDEEAIATPARFVERCAGWGVTVLDLPTAYWHELVAAMDGEGLRLPGCVRLVIIGGERALPERGGVHGVRRGGDHVPHQARSARPVAARVHHRVAHAAHPQQRGLHL
ncbi:MAG TPA: condensation domain-containing protein, partial [Longimicrobiaceae bacterium]|nr:condensation domain-containing protein [Longimicrobiaceae bacterium]